MPTIQANPLCANVKSRKFSKERCRYKATKGEFCSRHWKHPKRFTVSHPGTRSVHASVKKIQRWWRVRHGLFQSKTKTPAFFVRSLCHNSTELASFGPLDEVPRDYFFVIRDMGRFWGFDIRTLVIQYESCGHLENPYTKTQCDLTDLERFRKHVSELRVAKKSIQYEEAKHLTAKQSWNLRVLDTCLRLDMLGYRVATQWFTDLDIVGQRRLYTTLFEMWTETVGLTHAQREVIVPEHLKNKLFKVLPHILVMKSDMDSMRRTNLNVIERLISSAVAQSDRTLGAMYTVMALSDVSAACRNAYPWLS